MCVSISDEWRHFVFTAELLVGGYLLHYLPHFLTDRTLFLHQYLPCVVFKVLALAAVIDHIYVMSLRYVSLDLPHTVNDIAVTSR